MRLGALVLGLAVLSSSSGSLPKVAYRDGSLIFIRGRLVARHVAGAVRWSGDGKLVSVGGRVIHGPRVAAGDLTWAPTGERAAFTTAHGGVGIWTPRGGKKLLLPDGWGATTLAWNRDGALAIGRAVCEGACGKPTRTEIWVRRRGTMRRLLGPLAGDAQPLPFAWSRGKVLWWRYPDSASIAADGVALYANQTRVSFGLMYDDYVATCGRHLAVAVGSDRYAMRGKRVIFDGRNVSPDATRSWVSPSCTSSGRLVAAASTNTRPARIGAEHRAIWQLLPARRQLTFPPRGASDEYPQLLPDGSVVFVRTRSVANPRELYGIGTVDLLRRGRLTAIGTAGKADNYYGHYAWRDLVAVSP